MEQRLYKAVTEKLDREFAFKRVGDWLQQGECPNCHKKELYTNAEHPWVLRCNRTNKCGFEEHIKDRYSELFESWSDRAPKCPENPNATADAYMKEGRGFDLSTIKGWYTQDSYWDADKGIGSATVRFALPGVGYWERIIDRPQRFGKRKATFRGNYGGTWWQAPGQSFVDVKEVWIVEGVFKAIGLLHNGITATSTLTTNNYPSEALAALATECEANGRERPRLVFAYDDDPAGHSFTRKYCHRAKEEGWEVAAAISPSRGAAKRDWDDLHRLDRLKPKDLEDYRYHGALVIAESAQAKANLIYSRFGTTQFPLDFEQRLYWFKLDLDAFGKVLEKVQDDHPDMTREEQRLEALAESNCVVEICNCKPTPLYYMKNEITDESWYYFRVNFPHSGKPEKGTFTASQLSAPSEFKKRLLHMGAGAIWTGSASQLDRLLSRWTFNIKKVQTIDYIGYSADHGCYVYNDVAIAAEKLVEINDEDYFDIGKLAIKSLSKSVKLDINPDLKAYSESWFDLIYLCYGPRGLIVLAYWMGTLFAEQIRERFESFPFMEVVGEPGAGKSTLLETLWKLLGRNGYEGSDPLKGSMVGYLRTMAQVSNMPVVMLESDRSDDDEGKGRPKQAFNWDSFKSLYNGGALRTTGVKNSGNDTYEPQFRAALVISQNAPVQASPAIMERIIHVWFDKSRQSDEGREGGLALGRMTASEVSGFLVKAVTKEAEVLKLMDERQRPYEKEIQAAGAKNLRIQKNHAQLMVLLDALKLVCPISDAQMKEAKAVITELALEREQALSRENPMVESFWEAFEYLDGAGDDADGQPKLNHSRDAGLIAINLNHFEQLAAEKKQRIPPLTDLKRVLKSSRNRQFIEIRAVNSAINARRNTNRDAFHQTLPATVKCWVFKA